MKNSEIKILRNKYLLACILIGGTVEIIVGLYMDMLANSIFPYIGIFLGIGLTSLLAWKACVRKSIILTKRRAFMMALFTGLLSQIFVFVIFLLCGFAYESNAGIGEWLLISLFYGVYLGAVFGVMFCWLSIPLYFLIGYFLINPENDTVPEEEKFDILD